MEKLIPLLNEFINKTIYPYDRGAKCIWYENHLFLFKTWTDVLEDTIISNRYWFIKYLVENDKIKTECQKVLHTARAKAEWIWLECQWYSDYESLLMLLSISDEPISDLISYLK